MKMESRNWSGFFLLKDSLFLTDNLELNGKARK